MAKHNALHLEYLAATPICIRLQNEMVKQVEHLVAMAGLTLGVPIESRVKTWDSIAEKVERKRLRRKSLKELTDLVGVRVIFLFQRDLEPFHTALASAFDVISSEDTGMRLSDAQFGYQSRHYVLSPPESWKSVPSLAALVGQVVEVQARTLAQHIWAAASHKLQYKHEESVPVPVRRAIHRVSALLETVDLELGRVLTERDEYALALSRKSDAADPLNVAVVEAVFDEILPPQNKDPGAEDYAEIVEDLQHFGVFNRESLRSLILDNLNAVMHVERDEVARRIAEDDYDLLPHIGESAAARLERGVFFTHAGLAREALCERFGNENVRNWLWSRSHT